MTREQLAESKKNAAEADRFASECVSQDAEVWLMGYGFKNARQDIPALLAHVEELELRLSDAVTNGKDIWVKLKNP